MARLILICAVLCVHVGVSFSDGEDVSNSEGLSLSNSIHKASSKSRILYDYATRIVAYKDLIESRCLLEFLKNTDSLIGQSIQEPKNLTKDFFMAENRLSKSQIYRIGGHRVVDFCRGFPTYLIHELNLNDQQNSILRDGDISSNANVSRAKRSTKHFFVGRVRGQTQSQYLNFGNSNESGRAEAESTYGSSKAVVSGNSGMGQAQSQSVPVGCDECYGGEKFVGEQIRQPIDDFRQPPIYGRPLEERPGTSGLPSGETPVGPLTGERPGQEIHPDSGRPGFPSEPVGPPLTGYTGQSGQPQLQPHHPGFQGAPQYPSGFPTSPETRIPESPEYGGFPSQPDNISELEPPGHLGRPGEVTGLDKPGSPTQSRIPGHSAQSGFPPSYPTQPGYSTQPSYPTQPTHPSQPGYPTQPSHPSQPGYPTQPSHPLQPGYPTHPPQPGYPYYQPHPSYPGYTGYPAQPSVPSQPGYPQHSYPTQPGPGYPSQPGTSESDLPSQPGIPTQSGYPQQPGYLAQPGYPQQLGYPTQPGHSPQPGYTPESGYPSQPGIPSQTGYSQQPGYPTQPGYPSLPSYPTRPIPPSVRPGGKFNGELSGGYQQQAGQRGRFSGVFSGEYEAYQNGKTARYEDTGRYIDVGRYPGVEGVDGTVHATHPSTPQDRYSEIPGQVFPSKPTISDGRRPGEQITYTHPPGSRGQIRYPIGPDGRIIYDGSSGVVLPAGQPGGTRIPDYEGPRGKPDKVDDIGRQPGYERRVPGGQLSFPGGVPSGDVSAFQESLIPGARPGELGGQYPGVDGRPRYPIPGTQPTYTDGSSGQTNYYETVRPGGEQSYIDRSVLSGPGGYPPGAQIPGVQIGYTNGATLGGLARRPGYVEPGDGRPDFQGQIPLRPGYTGDRITEGQPGYPEGTVGGPPNDDSDSQAQTSVQQTNNETQASASAQGKFAGGTAQSQVAGTYSGSGSFSASAGSDDGKRGALTQVSGGKEGARSSAQGRGGLGQSQAQVQLASETGDTISSAQTGGWNHGSQTQVQASGKGGMADAQSNGPGSTSSQAQIGFTPYDENEKDDQITPFRGGGMAGAQSGTYSGQAQSQIQGKFQYGIRYSGAAQAGSGSKGAVELARNQSRPIGLSGTFPTFKPLVFTPGENPNRNIGNSQSQTVQNASKKTQKTMTQTQDQIPVETGRNTEEEDAEVTTGTEEYHDEDYDDYESGDAAATIKPATRSIISQKSKTQKQHIVLDPLEDLDATVLQSYGSSLPKDGTILQPGQRVPGSPGYQIPPGFRGRVKSIANGQNTYATGKHSQAQSVSLTPGTGRIIYKRPIYAVSSNTLLRNGVVGYGSGYTYQPANYFVKSGKSFPNFVSVTKSESGSKNPYTGEKTPSVYYTQSSSCGVFTNSCVFNGTGKLCFPKAKTNPDGTFVVC